MSPQPGSPEELARFAQLQHRLGSMYERVFGDPLAPRTVVVIPSLSMDQEVMAKISGVHHYEERLLCMLMLLRLPRTSLIYVTSQPVHPTIIDYYLHLLPGIPHNHAFRRLTMLSCGEASSTPLTQKILERPGVLDGVRRAIGDASAAHMACFNTTGLERSLAVRLGIPLYACDPALLHLGSKSGGRQVFRQAGVKTPDGREGLRDEADLVSALVELKQRHPPLRRAVVKLDQGFSGEGNAVFDYTGCPGGGGVEQWVKRSVPSALAFEGHGESWEHYRAKFGEMGGLVECFIGGKGCRSPSVQCRIDPLRRIEPISTHEQVLGGPSQQVFLGCTFPAEEIYRRRLQMSGIQVAEVLRNHGVLGRFGIDFLSVPEVSGWEHYALEINLRKGGTTHPFMMLQFLTDGTYETDTGIYRTGTGQPRCYYATDNLQSHAYRGLTADDLIEISVDHGLHFNSATQEGVVFHLIGALTEFGKLGMVCIAETVQRAKALYADAVNTVNREVRGRAPATKQAPRTTRSAR